MAKSFNKEYELLSRYQVLYIQRYNRPMEINKYKEKWAVSSLIDDFGYESVSKTLNYYFKLDKDNHPLSWFFSNFSMINQRRLDKEMDDTIRAERRAMTEKIVREYRNGLS